MSKRNTQEAKRVARERLRVEREQQARKEKLRRQLSVAGGIVAVLAIAGGVGFAVTNMSGDDAGDWEAAAEAKLVAPDNTSGANGTTILIGEEGTKDVLEVYEDPRCPACAAFEQGAGEVLKQDLEEGKYKASFVLATFIDDLTDGNGSKNAVSALGAALNVSEEAFLDYKTALYSQQWHPAESQDKLAQDSYLLKIAGEVEALDGNRAFEKAVRQGTYDRWALEMSERFDKSGVRGTPAFKANGKKLEVQGTSPEQFEAAVERAFG